MLKSISGFYFNGIGFNCHKRNKAVNYGAYNEAVFQW